MLNLPYWVLISLPASDIYYLWGSIATSRHFWGQSRSRSCPAGCTTYNPVRSTYLYQLQSPYLDQQQNQFLTSSTHWAKKMYKINYWHQYTIDAVQSYTFLRRTKKNCKNILNYCNKNVSFALLNGWNVTKTSFDQAWAGMEGSRLWTLMTPNRI